jgi:pSer/pThr/pTyr-binding forkhead associated (FHA) protein
MNAEIVLILRILMAIFLFAFIFFALITIWHSLKSGIDQQHAMNVPTLILSVQEDDQVIEKIFEKSRILLGRDPNSDLQINNSTISSKHAQFIFRQNQWWIEDLDSTNGSYLNQVPVEEPMVITNDDALRCGSVNILIKIKPVSSRKK